MNFHLKVVQKWNSRLTNAKWKAALTSFTYARPTFRSFEPHAQ